MHFKYEEFIVCQLDLIISQESCFQNSFWNNSVYNEEQIRLWKCYNRVPRKVLWGPGREVDCDWRYWECLTEKMEPRVCTSNPNNSYPQILLCYTYSSILPVSAALSGECCGFKFELSSHMAADHLDNHPPTVCTIPSTWHLIMLAAFIHAWPSSTIRREDFSIQISIINSLTHHLLPC